MKFSDRSKSILVACLIVTISSAVALAKDNGQGDRARVSTDADAGPSAGSAAPAAPSSAARVSAPSYRAVAPRYAVVSARPGAATRPTTPVRTFTNRRVVWHRPSAGASEGKSAPRVVRGHQPREAATDRNSTTAPRQSGADRTRATDAEARNSAPAASGASRGLDRKSVDRLRTWRGKGDPVDTVRAKHHDHRHHHHNRDWWRHHCDVFVLVGGGFWAWDAGWWYPAWGYNPIYSTYAFDEPVYGFENLSPDEVIANVQAALQKLGYYLDEVDGVLGPTTRAALENYQSDYGLVVTGMIDRETLASLGFVE